MENFSVNQRVWVDGYHGAGEVRRVDSTALGQEVVVKFDYAPSWDHGRTFLNMHVWAQVVPNCPLFGVFSMEGRDLFVTPEAVSPNWMEMEPERWQHGAVWVRVYSRENPAGVSGEVPISRIMELTPREFSQAKTDGWNHVPVELASRLDGMSL